jgi:nucleotide-binding universal stress UspA family protein
MQPTINSILYATDLSESARQALGYAVSLSERYQASLTILHVVRDVVELMSEEAGFDIEEHFGADDWRAFNDKNMARALETARGRVAEAAANGPRDNRCR